MINYDLSHELHSLAATVDEPFDLAALHRRMAVQSRRRAAAKIGVAGIGVAAVVGGLFVVREHRPEPAATALPADSVPTPAAEVAPSTLPDCSVALAELATAKPTPDTLVDKGTVVAKDTPNGSSSGGDLANIGFKGVVTILAIDGQQLTFRNDNPEGWPATSGLGLLDTSTEWVDGDLPLDAPASLQVGQQLGLATTPGADGVDHVIFIDINDQVALDQSPPQDSKPMSPEQAAKLEAALAATPDATVVVPGASLPPGPTGKSKGIITAVDATSITVTLDDGGGQVTTVVIDVATAPFYAGDSPCTPGALAVGTELGVAYHLDDTGNVVVDDVMLMA
jgi:hypothetical protein